jgi:hypothetical protein
MNRRLTFLFATAFGLLSQELAAQPGVGALDPQVVDGWWQEIRDGERLAREGQWKSARRHARKVVEAMNDRLVRGDSVKSLFASASFVEAVAEAGLGNLERAAWTFGVAQILNPELVSVDLSPYGEAGSQLDPWRSDRLPVWLPEHNRDESRLAGFDLARPRAVRKVQAEYPRAQAAGCAERSIVVQMFVDRAGVPRFPKLLTDQDPILGYAALEAAGKWRFEPATLGGKTIAVLYTITVNFALRDAASRCPSQPAD